MKMRVNKYISDVARKVLLVTFVGLLSGAGCSLPQTQAASESEQPIQTVGWVENTRISGVDSTVKAKLDTGATTTSINAEILEQPDDDSEAGGMIKFRFVDDDGVEQIFERPITRWVEIKSREGDDFRRPVVKMQLCVAGRWVEEEVNLADRDGFNYSILVGRNMLSKANLAVDSSQTFTAEPNCLTEEEQQ